MSGFPKDWQVGQEQQEWLDSLPPEKRHAIADSANALRVAHLSAAESIEEMLESMLRKSDGSDSSADFLTSVAFLSYSLRASARGNFAKATELMQTANRYQRSALPELD
ncbi:hypothetical protein [Sciscionella marina]|uniref:hypothetical protein n=1 Tax=Sciscionella marina TaxID=508770 RepID=UPI0003812E67|nr:hypothetical protein [Sciscionella marina]